MRLSSSSSETKSFTLKHTHRVVVLNPFGHMTAKSITLMITKKKNKTRSTTLSFVLSSSKNSMAISWLTCALTWGKEWALVIQTGHTYWGGEHGSFIWHNFAPVYSTKLRRKRQVYKHWWLWSGLLCLDDGWIIAWWRQCRAAQTLSIWTLSMPLSFVWDGCDIIVCNI